MGKTYTIIRGTFGRVKTADPRDPMDGAYLAAKGSVLYLGDMLAEDLPAEGEALRITIERDQPEKISTPTRGEGLEGWTTNGERIEIRGTLRYGSDPGDYDVSIENDGVHTGRLDEIWGAFAGSRSIHRDNLPDGMLVRLVIEPVERHDIAGRLDLADVDAPEDEPVTTRPQLLEDDGLATAPVTPRGSR